MDAGFGDYVEIVQFDDLLGFKELTYLGHAKGLNHPLSNTYTKSTVSRYFKEFAEKNPNHAYFIEREADWRPVFESYSAVWKSIRKLDTSDVLDRTDKFHNLGVTYADIMLREYLRSTPTMEFDIDLDTAPGAIYRKYGCKDKYTAIGTDIYDYYRTGSFIPIWSLSGKAEFQGPEELKEEKIRTFMGPPLEFLIKQKVLFTNQNTNLKNCCNDPSQWIKYGFVKQYGGFHKLFKNMEKFDLVWTGDVSGYDRSLQVQPEVYALRSKYLSIDSEKLRQELDYVVYHTINSTLLLPNGALFQRNCGNNSGSLNTTTDNSIAHVIMMFRFLIKAWYDHYGAMPTYADIMMNCEVNIMSDDNCGSLNSQAFGLDEFSFPDALRLNYAFYRLMVKEKALVVRMRKLDEPINGIEFLGSESKLVDGWYFPLPRRGKICSRAVYINEKEEFWRVLARITALTLHAMPVDELREYFKSLLVFMINHEDHIQCLIEHPAVYYEAVVLLDQVDRYWQLYLGLEAF